MDFLCINFDFFKYCTKISFISITEYWAPLSLLCQKQVPQSPHPGPSSALSTKQGGGYSLGLQHWCENAVTLCGMGPN